MLKNIARKSKYFGFSCQRFIYGKGFQTFLFIFLFFLIWRVYIDILLMEKTTRISFKTKIYNNKTYKKSPKDFTITDFEKQYINSIKLEIGQGDLGNRFSLTDAEKVISKKRFHENQFDVVISDKIPLLRRLPEKRRRSCFKRKYPTNLPKFDVIITFYNEAFSTLLRTIHSVLSRSPANLLNNIILIDDFSDSKRPDHSKILAELGKLNKVKYHRSKTNEGLIKSRQKGAELATADVIVFLDSHCECFNGWVEPLLANIAENQTHIITPIIVAIDENDFSISNTIEHDVHIGTITSKLSFNWLLNKNKQESGFKKK